METTRFLAEINRHYAISGEAIKPYGPVWRITSPNGAFVLKPMGRSAIELYRLTAVLAELAASGFDGLEPPRLTLTGIPFMEYSGRRYILTSWVEGSHPSFTAQDHLAEVAALYAKFHKAAGDVGPLEDWPLIDTMERFDGRCNFLETFPSPPKPNRIDRAIHRWRPYFAEQARLSCTGLKNLEFTVWLYHSEDKGFCHNDPAPRNIIMTNERWWLIDFELSGFTCFIAELATLLTRVLAALEWDETAIAAADQLLEVYNRIRPLTSVEMRILPYLCCFPQGFWRLCSQRYEEHTNWTERHFNDRLRKIILLEPKRRILLKSLFPEFHTVL